LRGPTSSSPANERSRKMHEAASRGHSVPRPAFDGAMLTPCGFYRSRGCIPLARGLRASAMTLTRGMSPGEAPYRTRGCSRARRGDNSQEAPSRQERTRRRNREARPDAANRNVQGSVAPRRYRQSIEAPSESVNKQPQKTTADFLPKT
jgi:hypothetical protein